MNVSAAVMAQSDLLWKTCIPHLSVDNVVFGFHAGQLMVLLTRITGDRDWILPGGYVQKSENVDDAVQRVLQERTGVKNLFLQQFATFGRTGRSESYFSKYPDTLWHKQRFVSIGYYALVDHTKVFPVADIFSDACEWKPVTALPRMGMDHQTIVEKALQVLQEHLTYKPLGYNLLPTEFTLPELQQLYEAILGYPLNRGNFYRRILKYEILDKQPKTRPGGAHKAPDLYRFNKEKYNASLLNYRW